MIAGGRQTDDLKCSACNNVRRLDKLIVITLTTMFITDTPGPQSRTTDRTTVKDHRQDHSQGPQTGPQSRTTERTTVSKNRRGGARRGGEERGREVKAGTGNSKGESRRGGQKMKSSVASFPVTDKRISKHFDKKPSHSMCCHLALEL